MYARQFDTISQMVGKKIGEKNWILVTENEKKKEDISI